MDRFEAFELFASVAAHRSFAAAARSLNLSPAATTRAVAALERQLGVALFHRTTRVVTLTAEGQELLDRVRDILALVRDVEHAVIGRRAEPQGELHVTAPVLFGRLHVMPVLAELLTAYPAMTTRLMLLDRNIRLAEEGIDVAVRIGPLADSSLVAVRIGTVRQRIVASPAYCERRGVPADLADLPGHDMVVVNGARGGARWCFGADGRSEVAVRPRLTVNALDAAIAAATAGVGLANLLDYQVADALAAGALVSVLDEHAPPPLPVSLVFPANRATLPTVRVFIEAMRRRFSRSR